MDELTHSLDDFHNEMNMAVLSRRNGNEGRARVCARRAAGIVVSIYLHRNNLLDPGLNAYERLKYFVSLVQVDEKIRSVAAHFLTQVDSEFNLPAEIDLIEDALWLAKILLEESPNI
jgi:hypothetical protein